MDENKNINPENVSGGQNPPTANPHEQPAPHIPPVQTPPQQQTHIPPQQHAPQTPPQQYQPPQYGYAPRPQAPQYQPQPQYGYTPQQPSGQHGKGGGWIGFLRAMSWVMFAIYELFVVIAGIAIMVGGQVDFGFGSGGYYYGGMAVFIGFVVLLVGTLLAFVIVGSINVALDAAQNIRKTANNTADMLSAINEINRKVK